LKVINAEGKQVEIDVFFDKIPTKGRPKKVLTEDALKIIEGLARVMCTDEEICSILGCSRDILYNPENEDLYRQAIEKGKANGKQSLRRKQYEIAMKGNSSMLIWLGKQWLNQTDKVEQTTSIEDLTVLADLLKLDEKDR
jgi:hypothetical protein